MADIQMTSQTLLQYMNFPSNDYWMLSELIDNSISSYIKNSDKNSVKGLKIEIAINKTKAGVSSLKITDNASGMDKIMLANSLKMGSKNSEKDSELNVYGVGLKQAAFFLGRKLSIATKIKNAKTHITHIDIDEIKNSEDQVVRYEISESKDDKIFINGLKSESGTCVEIGRLWNGRLTETKCKEMKFNLGMKYTRYLMEGLKMNLSFSFDGENWSYEINSRTPVCENTYDFITNAISLKKVKPGTTVAGFINSIKGKINSELKPDSKKEVDDIIEKIRLKKPFIWDVEEEIISGIKIKGQIGILAHHRTATDFEDDRNGQSYVKYGGYTIFQANRAILCAPNSNGLNSYNVITKDISGGQNHKRRWFGWIEIDNLYNSMDENGERKFVDLNTNKSGIQWNDMTAKTAFDNFIKNFTNKYNDILENYQFEQNDVLKLKDTTSSKIEEKINETVNKERIKLESLSEDRRTGNYVAFLKENEEVEIKIELKITDDNSSIDTVVNFREVSKNQVSIALNSRHSLWKPIVDETYSDEIVIELHKLGIVIALTQMFFSIVSVNEKIESGNFFSEIWNINNESDMGVSEVISYFANQVCVRK